MAILTDNTFVVEPQCDVFPLGSTTRQRIDYQVFNFFNIFNERDGAAFRFCSTTPPQYIRVFETLISKKIVGTVSFDTHDFFLHPLRISTRKDNQTIG